MSDFNRAEAQIRTMSDNTLTYDKDSNTVHCNGTAYPLKDQPSPLWHTGASNNAVGNPIGFVAFAKDEDGNNWAILWKFEEDELSPNITIPEVDLTYPTMFGMLGGDKPAIYSHKCSGEPTLKSVRIQYKQSDHWGIAYYDFGKGACYLRPWLRPDLSELGRTGDSIDIERVISTRKEKDNQVIECEVADAEAFRSAITEYFGDTFGKMECKIIVIK